MSESVPPPLSGTHLNDAVHVRDEPVDADLQQHHQRPAHVLADLAVLVPCQRKQTLQDRGGTRRVRRRSVEATSCSASTMLHQKKIA